MGENIDEAKGRIKEAAGDLTDDQSLKNEGRVDRAKSDVKGAVEDVKDKVDDVADKIKDKIRGDDDADRSPDPDRPA